MIIENAKAVFCILDFGYKTEGHLIGHSGGAYGDGCNVWVEEAENSIHIDDIFWDDKKKPEEPGFWVWEGSVEPVYDDAPNYTGEWRKANPDDITELFPEKEKTKLIKALDDINEFYEKPEGER